MANIELLLDAYRRKKPSLGEGAYIAQGAVVIGDVDVGRQASVWHNAVVRGDINRICIGDFANIQDNAVLHVAEDFACEVGDWTTIGHAAILHACNIGSECLIGMGATVLDGAEVGEQSIIGANALVIGGAKIPPGSMVVGNPAKVKRALTCEERKGLREWAEKYVTNAAYCLKEEGGSRHIIGAA